MSFLKIKRKIIKIEQYVKESGLERGWPCIMRRVGAGFKRRCKREHCPKPA